MALQLTEDLKILNITLPQGESLKPSVIPTSKEITGIELRLANIFIKDNGTPKIGPFPGFAKFYLIITVVSDVGSILQTMDLSTFPKVNDQEVLPVNPSVYYWKQSTGNEKAPSRIEALVTVVKSKKSLRKAGAILSEVKNDTGYSGVLAKIGTLVSTGATATALTEILREVTGIVGKYLGKVQDKPFFVGGVSYSDINGDYDNLGTHTIVRENDCVKMDFNLIVRDAAREKALLSHLQEG